MTLKKSILAVLTLALSASVISCNPTSGTVTTDKTTTPKVSDSNIALEGGYTKQDVTKPEYQEIVKTAVTLMNEKYKDRNFQITALKEIYTQVVAGTNYKLICEYKDATGSDKAEIIIYKDLQGKFTLSKDSVINAIPASPGDAVVVGGYTKQDVTKPEYQEIVKTAVTLMNEKYKDRNFQITTLKEIYTQVVAGINYKLICIYTDNTGSSKVEIIIYKDLQGKFTLSKDSVIN